MQVVTSLGIVAGLVFTALGLSQTAQSLEAAREEQRIAREGLDVARRGQITDRFSKAVEQLGNKSLDVRIGGVYALEKIIKDSPEYHETNIDVLITFLRNHAPGTYTKPLPRRPTPDLQAALTVISRNRPTNATGRLASSPGRWANLQLLGLPGANLNGADLSGADLYQTNLDFSYLFDANLSGAELTEASLRGAFLSGANLTGANLSNADLGGASLDGANLSGADLSHAKGLHSLELLKKSVKWDADTKWPRT
ncbi:pentapeptide repeat-containing protein [Acrocarpospora sp. B8E8]|uniref:pentapeptide repeat-containing protein n=1 Tax=Acrocarpospora sp. B8E8 TaxID=3153572 RepID=UPI00325F7FC6